MLDNRVHICDCKLPFRPLTFSSDMPYFPNDIPEFPQNFLKIVSLYPNSKKYIDTYLYQNEMISCAFNMVFFMGFSLIYWAPLTSMSS